MGVSLCEFDSRHPHSKKKRRPEPKWPSLFLLFNGHILSQMKTISTLIGIILCSAALSGQPYKDPSLPVSQRVEDLLGRMTLEEKIQQMSMTGLGDIPGSGAGWGACDSPFIGVEDIASMSARAKQYAREQTRLGIPPIQIAECLHGLLSYGATIFPQAIAQGSTWNPELIEEMAAKDMADELDQMRRSYSAGNASAKKRLANGIISTEKKLEQLQNNIHEAEKEIRNAENIAEEQR